jgi:hypothetical protein
MLVFGAPGLTVEDRLSARRSPRKAVRGALACVGLALAVGGSASAPAAADPAPRAAAGGACASSVRVTPGDSFQALAARCYGSRSYRSWVAAHNGHEHRALRAGETLSMPPFGVLAAERVASRWRREVVPIAEAFERFRHAEPEIRAQLHGGQPGMASYHPSARARAELEAAAAALRPVAGRVRAAGLRTTKLAEAVASFEKLASGEGHFSTDYAVEEIHQCLAYGVEALR